MNRRTYREFPTRKFVFLIPLLLVWMVGSSLHALAQGGTPALVTNGSSQEVAAINQLLSRLDASAAGRNADALRFFGVESNAGNTSLQISTRATHMAFCPQGALVRQTYQINSSQGSLASGVHELWFIRAGENFQFTSKRWAAPPDAVASLQEAAREEWNRSTNARSSPLLQLVVARRGGRWIALRRSRWEGAILDAPALAQTAQNQRILPGNTFDSNWMLAEMRSAPGGEPGTGHFIFQKSPSGWIGIDMAWETDRKLSAPSDAAAQAQRQEILGETYLQASAHRALGIALGQIGLFQEAADALEKAQFLDPNSVDANLLKQVQDARPRDPENLAVTQLENEARVGLDPQHPSYVVTALSSDYQRQPTVLRALRLGQEYSRLGDDQRAATWLNSAKQLANQGGMRDVNNSDRQWIQVLSEHLEERRELAPIKPSNTIRSPLFTLRCRLNDPSTVQVLASLEAAQHTVYADFGIPMSTTEVLLWRTQAEFQSYVTRFSAQGHSEFVAALTLTKLINTRQGPVVLGEEINVFAESRTGVFSTVAHEYGHVAVRQLSHGRDVPTWFNEGVATSVEGGYDSYLERVKNAAGSGRLLTMQEMLEWNVDGQRAFLAYSQANSLIDYIVATWGKEAILNILRRIGNDEKPDAVFQSVLGISQFELWNRWVRSGIQ